MKRGIAFLLWLIFVVNLIALVIALTDLWPNNSLKKYGLFLGLTLIVTGFSLRLIVRRKA